MYSKLDKQWLKKILFQQMIKKDTSIIVLGERIDQVIFPHLYEWAKNNPKELVRQLNSFLKSGGSISQNLINLESDLEHG